MSNIEITDLEPTETRLDVVNTDTVTTPNKRGHSAALDHVIDLDSSQYHPLGIEHLSELVRNKDIETLGSLGGVGGVASALQSDIRNGIPGDADDVSRRREAFGSNTYKKPRSEGVFRFLAECYKNQNTLLVYASGALAFGLDMKLHGLEQGWNGGGGRTYVTVLVCTFVGAFIILWQDKKFQELSQFINGMHINVVRSGRHQQSSIADIVVGDVIFLEKGHQIPADGLFIDGHYLKVDESAITRETQSDKVNVDSNNNPFLLAGCKVVDGYGKMLVTSVGKNTRGGYHQVTNGIKWSFFEETVLLQWLKMFRPSERRVLLVVSLLPMFVAMSTRFQNKSRVFSRGNKTMLNNVMDMVWGIAWDALIIASAVISYRNPAATNPALVYSTKKMMASKAMGGEFSAYKRLGSATTICTNKTGTLTFGQMKVTRFWLAQKRLMDPASSSLAINYVLGLVREGAALNTSGCVYKSAMNSEFEFLGSPMEKALLSWAVEELGMDTEELTRNCTILHVMAFNSTKKQSGMLLRRRADNSVHVHWKGAADVILNMCSKYYDSSGILKELDDGSKLQFEEITLGMASSGLQCIAFAHAEVLGDDQGNQQIKEDGLSLLGLVGINDACRPGVKDFVEECQFDGVKVRMITCDNIFVAKAIATKCGILEPNQDGAVIEGKEFRSYTPEERLETVDKICVMARSTPQDKVLMVQCLKQKGHKVAVIGARVNDEPALVEADVGLSMGIQHTKMAKEHSGIVILDDKFETVTEVLRWGRYVYNNIKKFNLFQNTANFVLLVIELVTVTSVGRSQLTTLKLVWSNLVVETLSVLSLRTQQPPVGRIEPLSIDDTWLNIFIYGLYQIEILLVLLFKGESLFGVTSRVNDTLIFSVFVLCQSIHGSDAVHLDWNFFKSLGKKKFWGMTGMTLAMQLVIVEVLKMISDTERLNWGQWIACIGIAIFGWPFGYVINFFGLLAVLKSYKYLASFANKYTVVIDDKPKLHLSNLIKNKDKEGLLQFEGVNGVVKYLKTDARKGLDGNQQTITQRQKEFGYNRYHNLSTKCFYLSVTEVIKDPLIWFLTVCALLSLGLNIKENGLKDGWYNGGSILIVVLVVVTICSVSHIWPQRQINKLSKMVKEINVEVIRHGKKQHVSMSNVVVGDIVYLKRGSRVPADGLFLHGHAVRLDESSLGEENHSVEVRRDRNPFLFYGGKVQSGFGNMLVTSVGENTKWAEITSSPGNESQIPLRRRLKRLSKVLGLVGSAIAVLLSVALMIHYFKLHVKNGDVQKIIRNDRTQGHQVWRWVVGIQISALAVASSAIPDGLPLAIAVTAAHIMNRMMNVGVLPRSFTACETIASTTTICLSSEGTVLQTDGVRKAVQDCKKAKVIIKLITRDNVSTAKATACECGILDPDEELDNEQVMQAYDFRNYTEAERREKVEKVCVLAEATSFDKLLFVKCLKDKGHIVAVTGQGDGDAHALKGADVGIHIGFQGTDIAVENSDIIVLQGGFESVVMALQVGRGIYDGIKVFIQFLFTANIVSLVSDTVSTFLTGHPPTIDILVSISVSEVPYAVVQMMWVKLIVGTLSALALVVEQKREDVMQKPPTKPGQPLISNEMCINILIRASYEIAILLTLQCRGEAIFNLHNNVKDTLVFNIFVLFRVFAVLTPWKSKGNIFSGIQKRKLYWGIVCAIVIIQIVIVETLPRVTATKTLNIWQWIACIGIAFTAWPVGYIGSKYIPVPKKSFLSYPSKLWKNQGLISLYIVYIVLQNLFWKDNSG